MKRDRKIQEFIRENRPNPGSDTRFMESLRAQIDLLPTPATLTKEEDLLKAERLGALRAAAKAANRRNILIGIGAALAIVCIAVIFYIVLFASPESAVISGNIDSLNALADTGAAGIAANPGISKLGLPALPEFHLTKDTIYLILGLLLAAATALVIAPLLSKDDIL